MVFKPDIIPLRLFRFLYFYCAFKKETDEVGDVY
jgi:hypothetical protein